MDDWRGRYARLLDALEAKGRLAPEWRPSFDAMPRHLFIGERVWRWVGHDCVPVSRTDDADTWWDMVYGDEPVITQVNDGRAEGNDPTSSSSMPSMVAKMLHHLDVHPGQPVLEIGTGVRHEVAHCK